VLQETEENTQSLYLRDVTEQKTVRSYGRRASNREQVRRTSVTELSTDIIG